MSMIQLKAFWRDQAYKSFKISVSRMRVVLIFFIERMVLTCYLFRNKILEYG